MTRKFVGGTLALALAAGGFAITGGPAEAKIIKLNASQVLCGVVQGSGTFDPPLRFTEKPPNKIVHGFQSFFSGCSATGAVGGAENIAKILITGSAKLKKAVPTSQGGALGPPSAVIKATISFMTQADAVLCSNKVKLVTGLWSSGGGAVGYAVQTNLPGGKALGGKCFKGKAVAAVLLVDPASQTSAALSGTGLGVYSINAGTLGIQ